MAYSMTGYGRGEIIRQDRRIIIEMKSVNNKYGDFQIRLPRVIAVLEPRIRQTLSDSFKRGKFDVFINFTDLTPSASQVICDTGLAAEYVKALRAISETASVPDAITAAAIGRFPEVLNVETVQIDPDDIWVHLILPALKIAVHQLLSMRETEGRKMKDDITMRLDLLKQYHQKIEARAPAIPKLYRERLAARLNTLLGDQAEDLFDEQRLAAEVAIYADKCAIDEELVRLQSHIQQMHTILEQTEPIGKKLDFLVQEINREINTIGSKANDLALTQCVVETKSELEKIREQVQNLE